MIAGGALLFIVVVGHLAGLAAVIPALWIVMFGFGFVGPNSAALAMQRYPQAAGSAAAVLGSFQFGLAAVIAPLAGTGGTADALPMVTLILALPVAAILSRLLLASPGPPPAGLRRRGRHCGGRRPRRGPGPVAGRPRGHAARLPLARYIVIQPGRGRGGARCARAAAQARRTQSCGTAYRMCPWYPVVVRAMNRELRMASSTR